MPRMLNPVDLKLEAYIRKRASHGEAVKRMQQILRKTKSSLTRLVIEERDRLRW